jgi:hypothetical protein
LVAFSFLWDLQDIKETIVPLIDGNLAGAPRLGGYGATHSIFLLHF